VVVFRALMIVLALAVILSAGLWVITRDRRWLNWAIRLLRIGVIAGAIFFAVLIVEQFSA
jgi:hypothetical protein